MHRPTVLVDLAPDPKYEAIMSLISDISEIRGPVSGLQHAKRIIVDAIAEEYVSKNVFSSGYFDTRENRAHIQNVKDSIKRQAKAMGIE